MSRRSAPPRSLRVSPLELESGKYLVFSWAIEDDPHRAAGPTVEGPATAAALTPSERAVHALLMAGLGDAEIAELRGTTRSTVTKQVDCVFRKVGVRSRRELIARGG